MKKQYTSPDLELFAVRPDEQIAVSCLFVNSGTYGYDCWYAQNPDGSYPSPPSDTNWGLSGS